MDIGEVRSCAAHRDEMAQHFTDPVWLDGLLDRVALVRGGRRPLVDHSRTVVEWIEDMLA